MTTRLRWPRPRRGGPAAEAPEGVDRVGERLDRCRSRGASRLERKGGGGQDHAARAGQHRRLSVTADRTGEALHADLTDYALQIAEDLQGETVVSIDPNSIEQPEGGPGYEVASVTTNAAREGDGAGRTLQVVVVRRPELAAYPMLIASGDNVDPAELRPIVNEIVASLRGRPVSPA